MSTDEGRINTITEAIIGCAFKVGNKLGSGYSEKCYENALAHELRKAGFAVKQQFPITVWYDDIIIGDYIGDLLVEDVLIELKAIRAIDDVHTAQCINYLTTTKLPICLLINFSQRVEVKRLAGPSFLSSSV
jgi:GxxExxY protein